MSIAYTVKEGDCLSSIAAEHGILPTTVWLDPSNQELRSKRKELHVLFPDDVLQIPDNETKSETGSTEKKHRFRRKGVPEVFKVQLLLKGEPRANVEYRLTIDDDTFEGVTNGNGEIETAISPDARGGQLTIVGKDPDKEDEIYDLILGYIDPIDEIKGAQGRLANLGYYFGAIDAHPGEATEAAIKAFQEDEGLEAKGELNDATRQKLESAYGA